MSLICALTVHIVSTIVAIVAKILFFMYYLLSICKYSESKIKNGVAFVNKCSSV